MAAGDFVGGIEAIGATSDLDIQPPAGETWLLTSLAASLAAPLLKLTDGTLEAIVRDLTTTAAASPLAYRPLALFITHDVYARVSNPSGSQITVAYSAVIWKAAGDAQGVGDPVVGIAGSIAQGATLEAEPDSGQQWLITEVGSDKWTGNGATRAPNAAVKLGGVYLTGSNTVQPTWFAHRLRLHIDENVTLEIENRDSSQAVLAYSGIRVK